jgi:hypothetical protein
MFCLPLVSAAFCLRSKYYFIIPIFQHPFRGHSRPEGLRAGFLIIKSMERRLTHDDA